MGKCFITDIYIEEVRHLKDIDIHIDENKPKHIVFTGKNGSGKTTILEKIKDYFVGTEISNNINNINLVKDYEEIERWMDTRDDKGEFSIKVKIYNRDVLYNYCTKGQFVFGYYEACRVGGFLNPEGVEKVKLKDRYFILETPRSNFLKYMVDLKTQQSFAFSEGDQHVVDEIAAWFSRFTNSLRMLMDDNSVELKFDYKNYDFKIKQDNRQEYGFNELSDGYSSVLSIVLDLMMRMESKSSGKYDMDGIVLIDEVENHLHIDLQKKIMKFLCGLFPNIQFVITTHSPFVLSSLSNSVIYDLENRVKVEDLSSYSYDGIVEGYFNINKYSDDISNKLDEYEQLAMRSDLSDDEKARRGELRIELKNIPSDLACAHCNNIKLAAYDNILDCTNVDVDSLISFRKTTSNGWKENIEIKPLVDDNKVNKTVELLNKVYDGTTPMKAMESININRHLRKELSEFNAALNEYYIAADYDREDYKYLIIKNLKSKAPFCAFKRWIIKDASDSLSEFIDYCK